MSAETSPSWASRLAAESGFAAVVGSCRDTKLLCLQRGFRLFAYGASFLILVQFLSSLGISDQKIGLFMTMTLLGDVIISFMLTAITDRLGRRRVLAAGAVLMVLSGVVFALSSNYWVLLLASVVGVISPSGNEIGPFRAVEESILAQLTGKEKRSDIFAWYTLIGTAGAALGTLVSGWMVQGLQDIPSWGNDAAYRVVFIVYAALGIAKLLLVLALSPAVEAEEYRSRYQAGVSGSETDRLLPGASEEGESVASPPPPKQKESFGQRLRSLVPYISPVSRSILYRLLLLFFLDSFASGMASPSWLTYFFTTVHSLAAGSLGTLFLVTNLLATVSNLLALPLARRLGPLKTMVFTHLPSAIFLALTPLPSPGGAGTWLAMGLLSLRACTQSMDQAPRQAFLSAAVLPSERTAVLGVVNVAKTLAQAGGIGVVGVLAEHKLWVVALSGAGALKATYDLLMLGMFLGLRDREDDAGEPSS